VEDLNVRGLAANRRLARVILDGGFHASAASSTTRRGGPARPSSSPTDGFPRAGPCACCSSVKAGLALLQRIFTCDTRGYAADRDLNAARNPERLAASSAVTAC
jgi:putative transposase